MFLSLNMLCCVNVYRCFKDSIGVSVNIFHAWSMHCVSNGVGERWNSSSVLLRWTPSAFMSRNRVVVIGDLVRSWCEILVKFCAPPCLASMCLTNLLYIFPSLPFLFGVSISTYKQLTKHYISNIWMRVYPGPK